MLSVGRASAEEVGVSFPAGLPAITETEAFAGVGVVAISPFLASCAGGAAFDGVAPVAFGGLLPAFGLVPAVSTAGCEADESGRNAVLLTWPAGTDTDEGGAVLSGLEALVLGGAAKPSPFAIERFSSSVSLFVVSC